MKKALIITYYWPPSGGGGVMRWLKMTKYFPESGWKPIIYTPLNPDASVVDDSLVNELPSEVEEIKTPIWEPYNLYRKLTGKGKKSKFKAGYISEASSGDWKSRLSVFIRGNFLIPDPRKFWVKPSIKFLSKYLRENPVDLIVSTGPPHSMHLIALGLKKEFNIPWIADFRDPWTDIDFYHKLKLTKRADRKHRKLEKEVLSRADHVVTVSPGCASDISKICNRKIEVVNNGFDPADFQELSTDIDKYFTISHFGAFNKDRNPKFLWEAISELSVENKEFKKALKIQLIGQTDDSILNDISKNNLSGNIKLIDHLPHKEGVFQLSKSQILLLPLNNAPNVKGILPGKMYEYMALKRPILALGPQNADFARIISETQAGTVHAFDDKDGIKTTLMNWFSLFQSNNLSVKSSSFEKYSRKNLAQKFLKLID